MSGKLKGFVKALIIILVLSMIFTGCSMLRPKSPDKKDGDQKKEPPKSLTQMEGETDKIISSIEDLQKKRAKQLREQKQNPSEKKEEEKSKEQSSEKKDKKQEQQKKGEGQGKEQQKQGQEQQGQQGQGQQQGKQKGNEPNWAEFEGSIEKLNASWNSYEPTAKKDGASDEMIESFEEQLNTLTEQVYARNEEKTLMAANKLYSHFVEFLNLYKHKQPPEVKEVRYLVRQILMYGHEKKWEDAKPLLKDMKKAWSTAKARMEKKDKNLNDKIDAAIHDFTFAINEEKINIARIKGNILLSNLDQVK